MVYNFKNGFGEQEELNTSDVMSLYPKELVPSKFIQFISIMSLIFIVINSWHDPIRAFFLAGWVVVLSAGIAWFI